MGRLSSRRDLLIGGVCVATATAALVRRPRLRLRAAHPEGLALGIPQAVGDWLAVDGAGIVLPPEDQRKQAAFYDDVATRYYQSAAGPTIMLLIAYSMGQSGSLQIHRPETCYPASGYTVSAAGDVEIAESGGRRVLADLYSAKSPDRSEQLLFWTRIGNAFPRSWHEQSVALRAENVKGYIPDGVLFRISLISKSMDRSEHYLVDFVAKFLAASSGNLKQLLLGPVTIMGG